MKYKDLLIFPEQPVGKALIDSRYIGRKPIYEFIKENCDNMTGILLDYGAGRMPYKSLFKNVEKYIGLDYDVAADSAGYTNDNVIYYDGIHVPLDDESVDTVLCNQVLEHVDDIDNSLSEIHRVMKTGGVLLLTLPAVYPIHMEPYDFRRFTHYGIRRSLEAHGFKDIRIKGSTMRRDTIRRLKLFDIPFRLQKIVAFRVNIAYLLNESMDGCTLYGLLKRICGRKYMREDKMNLSFPLDYLIVCQK